MVLLVSPFSNAGGKGQETTKSAVWSAPNFSLDYLIDGAVSKVVRTGAGINIKLRTSELSPGDAYTLLVAVFNDPESCSEPLNPLRKCTSGDLLGNLAENDVIFVAGHVAGGSGRGTFAGHVANGDNSGSIMTPFLGGAPAAGLLDPMGAELHILLFSHGQKLPEFMPSMIQTFAGGCASPPIPFTPFRLLSSLYRLVPLQVCNPSNKTNYF